MLASSCRTFAECWFQFQALINWEYSIKNSFLFSSFLRRSLSFLPFIHSLSLIASGASMRSCIFQLFVNAFPLGLLHWAAAVSLSLSTYRHKQPCIQTPLIRFNHDYFLFNSQRSATSSKHFVHTLLSNIYTRISF